MEVELRHYALGILGGRDGDKHLEDKHSAGSVLEEKRQEESGATSHCGSIATTEPVSPHPFSPSPSHTTGHVRPCASSRIGLTRLHSSGYAINLLVLLSPSYRGVPTQVFLSYLCLAPVPVSPSTDCVLPLHGLPS